MPHPRAFKALGVLVALGAALMALAAVAFGDNLQKKDFVAGGSDTIAAGGSTTITYRLSATGDDPVDKCNVDAAHSGDCGHHDADRRDRQPHELPDDRLRQ